MAKLIKEAEEERKKKEEAQRKNEEEEKVKEAEFQIQNLQMQYIIVIARNVTDNATEFENVAWVWTCQSSSHLVGYGSDLFEAVELGAEAVKKGRFSLMHFISFMLSFFTLSCF